MFLISHFLTQSKKITLIAYGAKTLLEKIEILIFFIELCTNKMVNEYVYRNLLPFV